MPSESNKQTNVRTKPCTRATCAARKKFSKQKAKAAFFIESFPSKGTQLAGVAASLELEA